MEYYCHRSASQAEFVQTINYLNKIGASVEPVTFDNVIYLKIMCPADTQEQFVGNNTLPDYCVTFPGGGQFYIRKLFHRNTLPNGAYQCVLFLTGEDHAEA
ncbi:MAG TPA: hypothetical protein VFU49_22440 [Ktedonobacteraceae bacterium]|nr:hypothetical protein [Ktedonobacteraceae bacterium]